MTTVNTHGCQSCQRAFERRFGLGAADLKCPGCTARAIAVSPEAQVGLTGGDQAALASLTKARCARSGVRPTAEFKAQVRAWFEHFKKEAGPCQALF